MNPTAYILNPKKCQCILGLVITLAQLRNQCNIGNFLVNFKKPTLQL